MCKYSCNVQLVWNTQKPLYTESQHLNLKGIVPLTSTALSAGAGPKQLKSITVQTLTDFHHITKSVCLP